MWQLQFCREPSSKFPAHHSPTFHLLPLSSHLLSWQVSAGCWQETPAPCYKTSPDRCLNVLMMWQLITVEKGMPEREREGAPYSSYVLISHTPSFLPHSAQRKWGVRFSPQPKGRRIRLHLWRKAYQKICGHIVLKPWDESLLLPVIVQSISRSCCSTFKIYLKSDCYRVQARSARRMTGQWIGDEVLRQGIRLHWESRQTEKMADLCLR